MKPWMIGLIVTALIGGAFYFGSQYGSNKVEIKYRDRDKLIHDTTIVHEFSYKYLPAKLDTLILTDSVYKYIDKPVIIATSDTVVNIDSSKIAVRYYFPPVNKFNIWASIHEKKVYIPEIHEIEKPETFWDRFGLSIQTGLGYGWVHKNVDFYTGIGAHFKFN